MNKPRMLWVCPHTTLRYEEIPLFIDAGMEVIPSIHYENYFWIEPQYDNEMDKMYPNWRGYCTMPVHVVERIRRTDLFAPSEEDRAFINQWLDIIYIAFFPHLAIPLSKWFSGIVIGRCFGGVNAYTNLCSEKKVDLQYLTDSENFIWCPILKSISEREDPRITRNTFYLPGFVSKERLPYEWTGRDSLRRVATLISYIHISDWYRKLYCEFNYAFKEMDHIVLGKNDKSTVHCQNAAIAGELDYKEFFSALSSSRMMCYGGELHYHHLHFTPIEAMTMHIPVLFHKSCGLTREVIENGIDQSQLAELGMCSNYMDMAKKARRIMDDFDYLNYLRHVQFETLLPLFSKKRALSAVKTFLASVTPYLTERRKHLPPAPDYVNLNEPMSGKNLSFALDSPDTPGEFRIHRSPTIKGLVGKEAWDPDYYYVRIAEAGIDVHGILAGQLIYKLTEGTYQVTVNLHQQSACDQTSGYFTFAIWSPHYDEKFAIPFSASSPGLLMVQGYITITKPQMDLTKEWRVTWMGQKSLKFINFCIKKIK